MIHIRLTKRIMCVRSGDWRGGDANGTWSKAADANLLRTVIHYLRASYWPWGCRLLSWSPACWSDSPVVSPPVPLPRWPRARVSSVWSSPEISHVWHHSTPTLRRQTTCNSQCFASLTLLILYHDSLSISSLSNVPILDKSWSPITLEGSFLTSKTQSKNLFVSQNNATCHFSQLPRS